MMNKVIRFCDLAEGVTFKFAGRPHPLGWPDGPWRKISDTQVESEIMVAQVENVNRRVEIITK